MHTYIAFVMFCHYMQKQFLLFEPHREKTGLLPMRKQRRRSASQ